MADSFDFESYNNENVISGDSPDTDVADRELEQEDTLGLVQWAVQNEMPDCKDHEEKRIVGYCYECEKVICNTCIFISCNGHNMSDIKEAIKKKKEEVEKLCNKIKQNNLKSMESKLEDIKQRKKECKEECMKVKKEVNTKIREDLIGKLMQKACEFDETVQKIEEENEASLTLVEDPVNNCLEETKLAIERVNTRMAGEPGLEILDIEKEVQELDKQLKEHLHLAIPSVRSPRFHHASDSHDNLFQNIGNIYAGNFEDHFEYLQDLDIVKEIDILHEGILKICLSCDDKVWVLCNSNSSTSLIQLNHRGRETRTIQLQSNMEICNLAVGNNTVYLALSLENRISTIPMDDQSSSPPLQTMISTGDLKPFGLAACTTFSGVWVGLVDAFSYEMTSNSRRLVACYSSSGEQLYKVEKDRNGSRLFTIPHRLAVYDENHNVVTVNLTMKNRGEIVLTDNTGSLIDIFPRRGDLRNIFRSNIDPTDVSFDRLGNIIFSDQNNRRITILDSLCSTVLKSYKHGITVALGCSPIGYTSIWCGECDGKISVLSILRQKW